MIDDHISEKINELIDSRKFNKPIHITQEIDNEFLKQSLKTNEVTFFSRSKQRLWVKGETSGNKLIIDNIELDCDKDALLIKATPKGPTCHLGTESCFRVKDNLNINIFEKLESLSQPISK